MKNTRIIQKPDLTQYFNAMPLIGVWLKSDYEKVSSVNQMIDLTHKWMNEAESSNNQTRKHAFQSAAQYLYSMLTGHSFESKLNIAKP